MCEQGSPVLGEKCTFEIRHTMGQEVRQRNQSYQAELR